MIDSASWPALHAEAVATARLLPPPFDQVPPRLFAGAVRGRGTGASVEFHDQRPWTPGDDPRRVHWAASARAGKAVLVQYREEARPSVDLILDCSPSMRALPGRAERAAALVAWIAAGARDLGASLRLLLVHGSRHELQPSSSLPGGEWLRSALALGEADSAAGSSHPPAPELQRLPLRPASQRSLISDLLFPGDPELILRPLLSRDGRAQLWAPFHPDEVQPPWDGHCLLEEPESAGRRSLEASPKVLEAYRQRYAAHFAAWERQCHRHRVPLRRVGCTGRLGEALAGRG